ncbi:hypothetical protein OG949_35135 [Streptomyces scopuliridis]|uniref:hypothetical protein n=1 Tax=Streptomyces scopuliridis TaxID=452529 RepID=UPI002DDB48BD|nr:hypothetical protein [Streptomyces scopuliridis]WSB37547.1 hypothetical protein OG949_35135 [Streptomyces scopuliridis]
MTRRERAAGHRAGPLLSDAAFTEEDVARAAAHVCAMALCSLDHPSGTAESLDGLVIPSTRRQQPLGWADLDRDDFAGCVRGIHRLVLSAADHTYRAVRPQHRAPSRRVTAHLGPLHPTAPVRGSDIRHAAISLCHALIGQEDGPALQFILDEPLASTFTLDGPSPTWGQLPAQSLLPALHRISRAVDQARTRIWIAVDTAIVSDALPPPPSTRAHGALPPRPPQPGRPHAR